MSYLSTPVGVYRFFRRKDGNPGYKLSKSLTLEEVLKLKDSQHLITKYREKKLPRLKEAILSFTPAGFYPEKRLQETEPEEQTGLVQIDIDGKTNEQIQDWRAYRDYLFKTYPFIAVAALSCGGGGLFLLVNTTGWSSYREHFFALAELLESKEDLNIDTSVSSPNEIRFMTLPGDYLVREDAKVFKVKKAKPVNVFDGVEISGDGKLIPVPATLVGAMRRQDIVDHISKCLHNAVPRAEVAAYLCANAAKFVAPSSHIHGDSEAIDKLTVDLYRRYSDQFGQAQYNSEKTRGRIQSSIATDLPGLPTATDLQVLELDKVPVSEVIVLVVEETLRKHRIITTPRGHYKYNGSYWAEVDRPVLGQFLVSCAISCGVDPPKATFHKFAEGLLKQIDLVSYYNPPYKRGRLNFTNGTLDLGTLKLQDHDPADYLFYSLPYSYDPAATCPKFKDYLAYVLPDKDEQETIKSYLGCCFMEVKVEKMLCLMGDGGNGKSVLLDVIAGILGEANVAHVNVDSIAANSQSADNYRLALENKIINISSESRFKNLDLSVWKQLASLEPVTVHSFHKNRYLIRNYARTIYAMNSLPANYEDITNGYFRRLLIVGFNVTVPDDKRNLNLAKEIVAEESAGVMNEVVRAIRRFQKTGELHVSKKSEVLVRDLAMDSDSVALFLDNYKLAHVPFTKFSPLLKDCYNKYQAFCETEIFTKPVGMNKFSNRIQKHGIAIRKYGKGKESKRYAETAL